MKRATKADLDHLFGKDREKEVNPDEWVFAYLQRNTEASAVNQDFHEDFHKQFPQFARKETLWGAQPSPRAMAALVKLWKDGRIERFRIGISGGMGFPKWVWTYSKILKDS